MYTLTKAELVERCKDANVPPFGTKSDMVQRIIAAQKPGVVSAIRHSIPPITIEKHAPSDAYVHHDTQLVFDPQEKHVVGRLENDRVRPLRCEDVHLCLKYKFRYVLPENLGASSANATMTTLDQRLERRLQEISDQTQQEEQRNDDDVDDEEEEEGCVPCVP